MLTDENNVTLVPPADWGRGDAQSKLRWLVAVQTKLIAAHNAEGGQLQAKHWTDGALAMFRQRQREHWNPRLLRVGAEIAALAATLPVVKPEPTHPVTWYRYDRCAVRRSLTAPELDAIDLEAVLTGRAKAAEPPDPYEDLTTFTEVDEDGDITLTAARCSFDTMRRDADSYVYKDYGAGHFTDYEHDFEICISASEEYSMAGFWAVTNDPGSYEDISNGQAMHAYNWPAPDDDEITLRDYGNSQQDKYETAWSLPEQYWATAVRSSTTAQCRLYSDDSRTTLVDTLTITCWSTAWRYLMCCFSRDSTSNGTRTTTGYTEELDVKEAAGVKPQWYYQRNAMRRAY